MKISIWLTAGNGKYLSAGLTDFWQNFQWDSEHIPLVGDNVSINLQPLNHLPWADEIAWIDGKVIEREFQARINEVEITLEIERGVGDRLRKVLDKN